MAKLSLGSHWRRRTDEQQREFVRIFNNLLIKTYLGRMESYTNEKFLYRGVKFDREYAEVGSWILSSKGDPFTILF